jgi:hypothetical protein
LSEWRLLFCLFFSLLHFRLYIPSVVG